MQTTSIEIERVADVAKPRSGTTLSIEHLSKTFGSRTVLTDINLTIGAGEFVAIIGRSGCGKTTLLRTIAGLEQATSGTVSSTSRAAQTGNEGDLGLMFQEPRLLPWKSVIDNVSLGLPNRKDPRVANLLQAVGLQDRAQEWPELLSGGQKQRVALARALVRSPSLLLLDEPLGALDALTRIEMQQLISNLWEERGFTAILVTHDVQEALTLADRIILLEDGKISMDLKLDLPRPRRGHAEFAELEAQVLGRILG